MSCITMAAPSGDLETPPLKKKFRSRYQTAKAVPEVVARQARITLLAFRAHDQRDAALAFLNDHSVELDGRPVDVAGQTDAGLIAATDLLNARTAATA